MRISEMFNLIQGHQITDEELYNAEGNNPVFTANNDIKGYWSRAIVNKDDLPCITYPTKANSGFAVVQYDIFDANNTAVLIPKKEYREKIIMEWFASRLKSVFLKTATSKEGVSYLNKEIVEDIDIEIPDTEIQKTQLKVFKRLESIKQSLQTVISKIERLMASQFCIKYGCCQAKEVPAKQIFDAISGNAGLTEEYIYSQLDNTEKRPYKLLTGSVRIENGIRIGKYLLPKDKTQHITVYHGEGIHIVRKGNAGFPNYLPSDFYTLNDDAYLLKIRDDFSYRLSLQWFIRVYGSELQSYASQSDNATWNKTSFMSNAVFDLPSFEEQQEVINRIEKLLKAHTALIRMQDRIDSLFEREFV